MQQKRDRAYPYTAERGVALGTSHLKRARCVVPGAAVNWFSRTWSGTLLLAWSITPSSAPNATWPNSVCCSCDMAAKTKARQSLPRSQLGLQQRRRSSGARKVSSAAWWRACADT